MLGFKNIIGLDFTQEESHMVINYIDEDGSGLIDYDEFTKRIYLDGLHQDSHKFLISESNFID